MRTDATIFRSPVQCVTKRTSYDQDRLAGLAEVPSVNRCFGHVLGLGNDSQCKANTNKNCLFNRSAFFSATARIGEKAETKLH